jgi:glucuronate isomerase
MEDMRRALADRVGFFEAHGCRTADHGMDYAFYVEANEEELNDIFARAKAGKGITWNEQLAYHTALLVAVGQYYKKYNWVNQLHFGCIRDNSRKMYAKLGPDTGFDAINDASNAVGLSRLLSALEENDALTNTVVYSLNPSDNGVVGTLIGCFQSDSPIPGRLQQGSAWWFNDHKMGMEAQMKSLMSLGAFGGFIGMLTDSRSFLSYTRHEYFRRILCNLIGELVENGEYPADMSYLGKMVENISYNNTLRYFRFDEILK